MVFRLRQPPQGPRPRMSAREVAIDVGAGVEQVMAMVSALGEYVQSPSSKLEEPVVRRLYDALGSTYETAKPKPPPAWQQKGRADKASDASNAQKRSDQVGGELSTWRSSTKANWWETQNYAAPAWELESWKLFAFTEAERDVWLAHGLRPGQVRDAAAYRDAGLLPSDLTKVVCGWTVLKCLQAGDPPRDVVHRLRSASDDECSG
jgi:hypothetical protein